METHICPHCSQPCAFKNGIMCTINGCIKDVNNPNSNGNNDPFSTLMNMFGSFGNSSSVPNDYRPNSSK